MESFLTGKVLRQEKCFLAGKVLQQFLLVLKHWPERNSTWQQHVQHMFTFTYQFFNISFYNSLFFSVFSPLPRSLWDLCPAGPAGREPDPQCCLHISLCLQEPALTAASPPFALVPPGPEEMRATQPRLHGQGHATGACCSSKNCCTLSWHEKEPGQLLPSLPGRTHPRSVPGDGRQHFQLKAGGQSNGPQTSFKRTDLRHKPENV